MDSYCATLNLSLARSFFCFESRWVVHPLRLHPEQLFPAMCWWMDSRHTCNDRPAVLIPRQLVGFLVAGLSSPYTICNRIGKDTMVDRGVLDSNGFLLLPIHSSNNERLLHPDFKPGNWDVICHNWKSNKSHSKFIDRLFIGHQGVQIIYLTPSSKVGNKRFKVCIGNNLRSFMKANSRSVKSAVITDIVTSIRDSSDTINGVGFVRFDSSLNLWYEVGDKVARDKVGQALRDTLRNRKSIKDETTHIQHHAVISVPRNVHEKGKKSNLPYILPYTAVSQGQNGCETGAPSPMVTVTDHNYSLTPFSSVTLDSYSDSPRWIRNDHESQIDHCFTSTSIGTCAHANPYMGCFMENVAEWFEHEMTA
eukprot:scaffold5345_cov86-Cylindrotheca_fusiformis.AAC.4